MKKNILVTIISLAIFSCFTIQAQEFSIKLNNRDRSYIVRLPQNYDSLERLPLHIFLHGGGFTIEDAESNYGFTKHADTSGYILVYPQGLDNNWSRENDLIFISSLIDTLSENYKIDKQRVYVSGHSAGGVLVNILACELSYKIAAFGDVSGFMLNSYSKFYKPMQPVPYVKIHGTSDDVIPYAGNSSFISVDSVLSFWKHYNKSQSLIDSVVMPDNVISDNCHVIKYTYGQDNSEIVFYKVVNGGHDAPDWSLNNAMGYTNRDINTPQVLWDFFKNHKLGSVKVTYIANAGFLIESDNKKVLIDALFNNGYGSYAVPSESVNKKIMNGITPFNSIDLFLETHNHDDHFNASLVAKQLKNNVTTRLISPKNIETQLKAQPDYNSFSNRIIGITPDWDMQKDTTANGIPVKILRMHHDVATDIENNAYLFELAGLKILHMGDYTGNLLSELNTFDFKNQAIDIAFINYYCFLDNPNVWQSVMEGINAKYTIFYHIDNNNLKKMLTASESMKNTTVFSSTFESTFYNIDTSFIINKAPDLIKSIPDTVVFTGQEIKFKIENKTFTDDYNDFLFYEAKLSDGDTLPSWLNFNSNTKYFNGTPLTEENLSIEVIATDFAGASISDVFKLSVKQSTSGLDLKIEPVDISIFPNPAKQTIQIRNNGISNKIISYELIDGGGRFVKQGMLESETIDISGLAKGVFILCLKTDKEIISKKIVVE